MDYILILSGICLVCALACLIEFVLFNFFYLEGKTKIINTKMLWQPYWIKILNRYRKLSASTQTVILYLLGVLTTVLICVIYHLTNSTGTEKLVGLVCIFIVLSVLAVLTVSNFIANATPGCHLVQNPFDTNKSDVYSNSLQDSFGSSDFLCDGKDCNLCDKCHRYLIGKDISKKAYGYSWMSSCDMEKRSGFVPESMIQVNV